MKFYAIKPADCAVETIEAKEPYEAYKALGLDRMGVDHGTVARFDDGGGVAIVVYEFSLFVPVDDQRWYSILGQLFGGNALLYGYDAHGETCEFDTPPPIVFYPNAQEVEKAIERGEVKRPQIAVNQNVLWRWPEPHEIPDKRK